MPSLSKPPRRLTNTLFAILAVAALAVAFTRAQEPTAPTDAPAATTDSAVVAPPTAEPAPATSTSAVPTTLPATPDANAHAIVAPALEPINPGYSGAPNDPSKPVVVHIVSPKPEEILGSATADIFFTVENYTLADGGNRLHVIVNNNDPIPVHDLRQPLTLKELPEGGHTIRVMAVQPDGHSLTNPESFAMTHFFVRKKNFQNYAAANAPYLTVNLPVSGIVDVEEGGRVWFDFRTHNAPLAPNGFRVHYKINNVDGTITEKKPVFWDGMKPGRYELMVELLDPAGSPVLGVFNQVKRSFDVRAAVKALPAEAETPAAAPATAPATPTHGTNHNSRPQQQQPPPTAPRALPEHMD